MSSTTLQTYWKRIQGRLSPVIASDIVDGDLFGGVWFDGGGPPDVIPNARAGDYYLDTITGRVYKLYPD